ncbi:hypothetical protein [Leuconostoc citreum]|uniref:hypothetical protein n=1 Tax=Leuconostoc citreum TaxID=33964 RepID=UPI0032DEDF5B
MKKVNAKKFIVFVLLMMSLHVLLTNSFPVLNKILAVIGLLLLPIAYQFDSHKSHMS